MAISLKKGQGVSLRKSDNDLSMVTIGLGWDIQEEKTGFLGGLFSKKAPDYDLDVAAFLCGSDGKVHDLGAIENGKPSLKNGDVIFYNNLRHHSGQIWLTGDNRTGDGDGDDEQIIVKLNDLPEKYAKLVFIVQIYKGTENGQSFGKVRNAFIRAVDGKGREMTRFDLSGGAQYAECRSMLFAELTRETDGWKFNAIGTPSPSDSFVGFLKQYV
ncbi:MAG: TerD family protein [Candidatus Accumulibacter phosphatis]|jgi:stress response protein SCP2|uniref:Stress response protein SCP2 n=2 Tax=Candidatus Accumulibacter TaxID=327159 RepID=A0A080LUV9_9PROT|nr:MULTISPECIES: TerD family protein [Candidatus Accumulibacter]KFB72402.1 MAG: Stress response protein SCP2 [Candidatus Accumulibacter phosphatis]MBL8406221.1 TerD family protein [Accumulibacter sp.]NMQ03894.1 TerD family protein [Candidatus Accumulibacter contiguus]HCZ13829.1 TerD family protein [Accumulibacter sp.]HRF10913.1 TerD family protein [Candidatus Accumulibacter phosphatis]